MLPAFMVNVYYSLNIKIFMFPKSFNVSAKMLKNLAVLLQILLFPPNLVMSR